MRKVHLNAILIICIIALISGLTGCARIHNSPSGDNMKSIDYNQYLKKDMGCKRLGW